MRSRFSPIAAIAAAFALVALLVASCRPADVPTHGVDLGADAGHKAGAFQPWGVSAPGGSNTQVQYNASGSFAGNANLTFNSGTGDLTAVGGLSTSGTVSGANGSFSVALDVTNHAAIGGAASVAQSGLLRFPNDIPGTISVRNAADNGDITAMTLDSSDRMYLGTDASFTSVKQASIVNVFGSSSVDLGVGSGDYILLSGNTVQSAKPIVGETGASSPYGVHGEVLVPIPTAGASLTFSAAQYADTIIDLTGASSGAAAGPMILPGVGNNANAYWKIIRGNWSNSGNQPSMVISASLGAGTVTIGVGKTAIIGVDTGGVFRISPDT